MSLFSSCFVAGALFAARAAAFTGHEYQLTYEYSGANFFDDWDFYTVRGNASEMYKETLITG